MTLFHAVMQGEDGMEFGADIEAIDAGEASDLLGDRYPESRIIQLESPDQAAAREADLYESIRREIDGDDDYDED